jgi:apolipoprotein N-acyltransferase
MSTPRQRARALTVADSRPAPVAPTATFAALAGDPWTSRALALLAGLALAGAFAPFDLWPCAVLAPAVLLTLWLRAPAPREAALLGFAFSAGTYGAGTWWLYISIHGFGQAPVWLALLLLAALVGIMSAWQAALGYVLARWLPRTPGLGTLVAMPAAWLLVEWWRGWFLSGFPWLSLGYSQTDSWLRGFAPVGGVYLVSFVLLLAAGGLVTVLFGRGALRGVGAGLLLLPWPLGYALDRVDWTHPAGAPTSVAILQGAIPQDQKWLDSNRDTTLDLYRRLHTEALGARLIVWPESAPPDLANNIPRYLSGIWSSARALDSDVLMGVVRVAEDGETYYNSILALGAGEPAFYNKHHLVPFGEYFPVPSFVRQWLRLMSLPYSDFTPGGSEQPPLAAGGMKLAASICYEDAYPGAQRGAMRAATMLVNVTNDAWFGKAGARYQHFQIARMRAIESRRFMLRAANDGVSAVIDERGRIVAIAPEYEPAVLRGMAQPRAGATPWLVTGNTPVVGAAAVALALLAGWRGLRRRRPATA